MRIMLAPMEGVTDVHMRSILTRVGGFDRCVTEFLRVTDHLYPDRVFLRCCPELEAGGVTASKVPVYLQLLGSDGDALADNAQKAVRMGAVGIDLNFGCPAKTVNRHGGGSALLREPQRVADIVSAVRQRVDPTVPVTAKIRLGFQHSEDALQIGSLIETAGASELCVHARTREQGYRPPAQWYLVQQIRDALTIPVIVNGEIWAPADAETALQHSGCTELMLGRGALSSPDLALRVRNSEYPIMPWSQVLQLLFELLETAVDLPLRYAGNRTKQWLTYLRRQYPQAPVLFTRIKKLREIPDMRLLVEQEISRCLRAV